MNAAYKIQQTAPQLKSTIEYPKTSDEINNNNNNNTSLEKPLSPSTFIYPILPTLPTTTNRTSTTTRTSIDSSHSPLRTPSVSTITTQDNTHSVNNDTDNDQHQSDNGYHHTQPLYIRSRLNNNNSNNNFKETTSSQLENPLNDSNNASSINSASQSPTANEFIFVDHDQYEKEEQNSNHHSETSSSAAATATVANDPSNVNPYEFLLSKAFNQRVQETDKQRYATKLAQLHEMVSLYILKN